MSISDQEFESGFWLTFAVPLAFHSGVPGHSPCPAEAASFSPVLDHSDGIRIKVRNHAAATRRRMVGFR